MRPGSARLIQLLVGLLSLATLTACVQPVGPARTEDDYELKAVNTAEAVLSAVGAARITAQSATDGELFAPYVAVALDETESAASGAQATFEGIQPPSDDSAALRDALNELLDQAIDVLTSLRVEARRGDLDDLARTARPLERVASRLDEFVSTHGRGLP